jgi:hypothetical protein
MQVCSTLGKHDLPNQTGFVREKKNAPKHVKPELVFTELILQILYWIYAIAIHSHVLTFDLPTNIDLRNLCLFIFTRN